MRRQRKVRRGLSYINHSFTFFCASLQWYGLEFFERLVARVNFYAGGFQSGNTEQGYRVRVSENDCGADYLPHEFDFRNSDVKYGIAAVGKAVLALSQCGDAYGI